MEYQNTLFNTNDFENLHLCFLLDYNIYAINAQNVLEVATLPLINNSQKLPEYIAGILNYNDLFINVVDLRKVLSLPQAHYKLTNKIIIIKGEESLFAVIVDKVTDFFTANLLQIQRVMGENHCKIIKNFYKINDDVVNIIDITSLENIVKKVQFEENTTNYDNLFPQDEESICILQKRQREIAKIPSMNLDTTIYGKDQYIIFKIGNHRYCLYSYYVKELITLKNYPLTTIPYTPEYIMGIINHKGSFYSVLNLKNFVGLNENNTIEDNKVIVLESQEIKLALLVDDIINIINIAEDDIINNTDKKLDALFIKGEAYINNEIYNILNLDKLINDERLYINMTEK